MISRILIFISILAFSVSMMAQDKPAYRMYDANGKAIKYKKAVKLAQGADVVLFGELHNDPIAHWLEQEVLRDLVDKKGAKKVVVGAEMFERHQAKALDDYMSGTIDEKAFRDTAKMWSNYATDYRPVVEFCKSESIKLVATNVPRRYARMVAQGGPKSLDTLSIAEKAEIAPLPYEVDYNLPSYLAIKDMMRGHMGAMNMDHFVAAQAIKDATMAHFIFTNRKKGQLFYHLNGSYHSDSKEGIAWYLKQSDPEINIVNITVVKQDDIGSLEEEHKTKADIIIVVPSRMTTTY
ncbi:MAG: ChaN family lipoprotein [Bacteroidia bacterium]